MHAYRGTRCIPTPAILAKPARDSSLIRLWLWWARTRDSLRSLW